MDLPDVNKELQLHRKAVVRYCQLCRAHNLNNDKCGHDCPLIMCTCEKCIAVRKQRIVVNRRTRSKRQRDRLARKNSTSEVGPSTSRDEQLPTLLPGTSGSQDYPVTQEPCSSRHDSAMPENNKTPVENPLTLYCLQQFITTQVIVYQANAAELASTSAVTNTSSLVDDREHREASSSPKQSAKMPERDKL